MKTSEPLRLATLDGWRCVAVLIVIWGHLMPGFYSSPESCYSDSLSRYGGFGVDVFFGISGLLITYLQLEERRRLGRISLAGFYTRRAFRILPPCLLYLGAVLATAGVRSGSELMSCVFFFRNYLPFAMGSNATFHLWSLSVEEHFYLLWPALLVFVVMRSDPRSGVGMVAWMAIGCALWRIVDAQNQFTAFLLPTVPVHFRTDLRMDALLWGCVAAFLIEDIDMRERLRRSLLLPAFLIGIVALLLCIGWYSQLTSLWLAMLTPIVLVATVLHPEWFVSRLLDCAGLRFMGRMSYSLYLWQQIFLVSGWEARAMPQRFPQNLVLTFACAYLSYRYVEKPCMRFGHALSERLRSRDGVVPSLVMEYSKTG